MPVWHLNRFPVDEILSNLSKSETAPTHLLKTNIDKFLNKLREEIKSGDIPLDIPKYISLGVNKIINKSNKNNLRSVINGTGIILNTGLGRAPISKDIIY